MKISGIYKIQSVIKPERCYIGSAVNIQERWRTHLNDLRKNEHHSIKLQRHFNKYEESDLVFIIIEPCLPEFLTIREQFYLDTSKPYFNVYMVAGSPLGTKASDETKEKLRISHLGQKAWNKGNKSSKPAYNKGKKGLYVPSKETKQKQSRSLKGRVSGMKGKHQSEESNRKNRESHLGLNTWTKGRTVPEETKKKMSETQIRIGNKPPSTKGKHWKRKLKII